MNQISDFHLRWLEKRGIDAEVALKLNIISGAMSDGEVIPSPKGEIIVFRIFEHGVEVGRKYRGPNKKFWQKVGGRRTFINSDVMDDPALEDGRQALVIVEGEIDLATLLQCGRPFAVSVPDGAPAVPKGMAADDLQPLDPEAEQSGKFEFMYLNRDRLKRTKRFVIAVDNDPPGKRLAAELVRRLGAAKCSFITYPIDPVAPDGEGGLRPCKDLNEVLMFLGRDKVLEILDNAKPYPVRGLYSLSEYPPATELETYATGFDGWAEKFRLFFGSLLVITGIPSHGKSTWTNNLLANLAMTHGWKAAICSPEMPAVPIQRDRFRRLRLGRMPMPHEVETIAMADAWIEKHFLFIDIDPTGTGDGDDPFDLEWIIDRATDAVLRHGIRVLVLDPWNEIEHARQKGESMVDYIGRGLRALKRFAKLYGVVVIVVAHPTKEVNKEGKPRPVNLYDIEGAAHWFNKCDQGIVVEKLDDGSGESIIHVLKMRFEETGRRGDYRMQFDPQTGRFISPYGY